MQYIKFEKDKDVIDLNYNKKNQIAYVNISQYHNHENNLEIFEKCYKFMKGNNIKWIILPLNKYTIPINCFYTVDKSSEQMKLHIEDYERFYNMNMYYLIEAKNIIVDTEVDGWNLVIDINKERKKIHNKLKENQWKKN